MTTLIKLVAFFCLLFISCQNQANDKVPKKQTISVLEDNGLLIFEIELIGDTIRNGRFSAYNNYGVPITSVGFENSLNNFSYVVKQFDSNGKIVYDGKFANGKIISEIKHEDFQKISLDNGRYLYINYLSAYDFLLRNKIKHRSKEETEYLLIKSIDSLSSHDNQIPSLNENEKKAILYYLTTPLPMAIPHSMDKNK